MNIINNRTCGRCNECCVHISIPVLDKPAGVPCQHLCAGPGCCGIYEKRPSECAAYQCAWLDGHLPQGLRPDHSGILLDAVRMEQPTPLTLLMGSEIRPGAAAQHLDAIQESLSPGTVAAIVIGEGEMELLGAPADRETFIAWMANIEKQGGVVHRFADGTFFQPLGSREMVRLDEGKATP